MKEYIQCVTHKENLKCCIESFSDSNYQLCDFTYVTIKSEYENIVDEMNNIPSEVELLSNITKLLQILGKIDRNIQNAHRDSFFLVQKWINGYIEKQAVSLVEAAEQD